MIVTAAVELDITDLPNRSEASRYIPYLGANYSLRLIVGTLPPDFAIVRAVNHADPHVCQVTASTRSVADRWRTALDAYTPEPIEDELDHWDLNGAKHVAEIPAFLAAQARKAETQ